jgi:hypothetical protein
MNSVAVQAERIAQQASGAPPTPTTSNPTPTKPGAPISQAPQISISVPGGHYENGKVYLKGNTLKQVKDIYCPHCKLPRLVFPVTGVGARLPDDPNQQYCNLHPFIQKPGHDIYGNPFPIDQTNKTKRERELIKKQEKAERDNTPGSQDTNEDGITGEQFVKRMLAGGKPASYVPWHTCPLCKRSLLITKFAQHLEKCLGIGGRAARNTAAARLSGMNGSVSGSVQGSRMGTPTPSSQGGSGKRGEDDDDDELQGPPRKKTKKDQHSKKDKKERLKEKLIIKVNANKDGTKRPPKGATSVPIENGKRDGTSSKKREREDTGDDPPLKKAKLTSNDSTSTGSP